MITKEEAEKIFEQIAYNKKTYKDLAKEYNIYYSTLCKWMKNFKESFGLKPNEQYSLKAYLKYKYKDQIINSYTNGNSTIKIAEYYNTTDRTIADLLRECNIKVRSVGYTSKTNQSLFAQISNEIEAYSLGLITSDGSVSKNYSITITLHENDKYILEKINLLLCNNTGTISQTPGRTTVRLVFNGKQICKNLEQYNVVPNKSHKMNSIYFFKNNDLMRHYIRGLFDGDGVCSKNGSNAIRLGYCAHIKEFTESYQDFLCSILDIKKNKLFDTGGSWNCSWGARQDIEKIYNYLYKDATIYLDRKKNKIENYLYGNTEVTN